MRLIDDWVVGDKLVSRMPRGAREAMSISWATLAPNIRWLAWFGVISHPAYLALNVFMSNGADAPILRLGAVAACIYILWMHDKKQNQMPSLSVFLAIAAVFFALPFFFFFVLIQNSIDTGITDLQLASRQVQCAFSVMAIALLIYDARLLVFGTALSFLFALLMASSVIDAAAIPRLIDGVFTQFPFWLFALLGGIYFNRNKVVIEREKLNTLSTIGGHLAHELRTPLASIAIKMHGALKLSEPLVSTRLDELGSDQTGMRLFRVRSLCSEIISDTKYANSLIDMFLVRAGMNDLRGYEDTIFSAESCVQEALLRYPFQGENERSMVKVEILEDYEIQGPFLLYVHVVLNLLKNAFSYAQLGPDWTVRIRVEVVNGWGHLSVVDNGVGIPKENLERVFSSFFTTSSAGEGAGVGLHFCRKILRESGGELLLDSEQNIETAFTMKVPLFKKKPQANL